MTPGEENCRRHSAIITGGLLLLCLWTCFLGVARAADTGFKTTGTIVSSGSWTNFTTVYINSSNDQRAYVSSSSSYGVCSTYGFSIPADARIDGIEVQVEGREPFTFGTVNFGIQVSWNNGSSWVTEKTSSFNSSTDATSTFGGSSDTWGRSWTDTEFSDANFQLRVRKISGILNFEIDFLQVRVYYTNAKTWDRGAGTNNWGDANNWNPDGVPLATENVSLTGADTIDVNVAGVCNSITLNNAGLALTVKSGNSLTASFNFKLTSGTLNTEAAFPTVTGTTTISAGTVGYNGSGAQAVLALNYYNLTLSNAGTKTIATATTVAGDMTTSGTVTASCSGSLTVSGNVVIGSGTTFNGGSGTVDFNGTLTITSATFTATSGSLSVAGNLTISGSTFAHNSGTVVFDGTDATLTSGGAAFNNFTVNAANKQVYLSASGSLTVNGTLSIQTGYLIQDPANNLSAGSISIGASGRLRNYGTGSLTLAGPVSNSGTIDFDGGGDASCTGTNRILIRSSVNGTQRAWSSSGGTFQMVDVDIQDQAGTAAITCYGSQSSGNNGANWTINTDCAGAPTAVTLVSFGAQQADTAVKLQWQTGYEVQNLGFHIYRESGGVIERVSPSLIAGSALFAGARTALGTGRSYEWWDRDGGGHSGAQYWLEDIGLDGNRTRHGPVTPAPGGREMSDAGQSPLLKDIGRAQLHSGKPKSTDSETQPQRTTASDAPEPLPTMAPETPEPPPTIADQMRVQIWIAGQYAVKLLVKRDGWYRATQAQLIAAGLNPDLDPRKLQLYAAGVEQAIVVSGEEDGHFDSGDSVEFFGLGIDTPWTDQRAYWLIEGPVPGKRVRQVSPAGGADAGASFRYDVELKPRTIHFGALLNGDAENFFGNVVDPSGDEEILRVHHLDNTAPADARLEITLQGATKEPHQVRIDLNGAQIGVLSFEQQMQGTQRFALLAGLLRDGDNTVHLVALGSDTDISLVASIRLSYWHTFTADGEEQRVTAGGGREVTIGGFTSTSIRVVDVSDPANVSEINGRTLGAGSGYEVAFSTPDKSGALQLLAFGDEAVQMPAAILPHAPSHWSEHTSGADVILVTHESFQEAAASLASQHKAAGLQAAIVNVADLYDEFSFGLKNPSAIRDFVLRALATWSRVPRWLVLLGDASFDPRDYLGLGAGDFVPTKLIDTQYLETASDDWFADANNDGIPELAIGRLPVRTPAEANALVAKLAAYRKQARSDDWAKRVALVADANDTWDFEAASEAIKADLGADWTYASFYRGQLGTSAARPALLAALEAGNAVVNYFGHGSVELWHDNLLTSEDARNLGNGVKLPLFLMMTCLNGFFVDVYSESLGEALLKDPDGGAVAVWASSGLAEPDGQLPANREVYSELKRPGATLGQAVARAKAATSDADVRRTWVLLGDPTLGSPVAGPAQVVGDINGDGVVNVLDLQLLVNIIHGVSPCTGNCDLNGDGSVNLLDLQILVNIILGV